jgi:hypothetical protein
MRVGLTAGVVLSVVALSAPAATATSMSTLTLTASRSERMTVTFRSPVTVFNDDPDGGSPAATIDGGGPSAGFVIVPSRTGIESIARLRVPSPDGGAVELTLGRAVTRFPAGLYTLRVVASAPVTIRIPVRGMRSMTWQPVAPLPVTTTDAVFGSDVGRQVTGTGSVVVTDDSVVFALVTFRASGARRDVDISLARTADCTSGVWQVHAFTQFSSPLVDDSARYAAVVDRRAVPHGSYYVCWTVSADVVLRSARAVAVVVG